MNAKELFLNDMAPAWIWFCSKCRNVAKTQELAEDCCKKHYCRICGEVCKVPFWRVHLECKKQETIAKAEKLESWEGWVYLEGFYSEYFPSVADLLDEIENNGEVKTPEFVFICNPIPFKAPDVDQVIEWACEDHYDSAADNIQGEAQLAEALKAFEDINYHIISYEPDFTKMVRVRKAK